MKISIDNFKTLKILEEFEFKPFTLITGVNSSGKSSLIQFLLLLKQTLGKPTTSVPLNLNDYLIELGTFEEIIYQRNVENNLSAILSIDNREFTFPDFGPLKIENCQVKFSIMSRNNNIVVKAIEFNFHIPSAVNKNHYLRFVINGDHYEMTTSTSLFNKDFQSLLNQEGKEVLDGNILFSSFFPQLFTTQIANPEVIEAVDNEDKELKNEFDEIIDKTKPKLYKQYSIAPNTKSIEEFIAKWFAKISYIGPLREAPSEYYHANKSDTSIGKRGEYAAWILEKEGSQQIEYYKLKSDNDGLITFSLKKDTFLNAVNHWVCDIFKLAKNIHSIESQDSYQVFVVNNYGVESTINHVGFGISQVLPIIVEGLRMAPDSLLLLEQPEIHLHPKIQGQLFDFFYSLVIQGKKMLIETHSDHLIVRMRRRIAEDQQYDLLSMVNLEFVETGETSHYFESIELSDLGSIKEFPNDFIEQQEDYRAIVKAQARKKLK